MSDKPFRALCSLWREKIDAGLKDKKKAFSDQAMENLKFFNGPHDFMYGDKELMPHEKSETDEGSDAPFRMTVNKVFEAVSLIGPHLYHRNPNRRVTVPVQGQVAPELLGDPMLFQVLQQQEMQRKFIREGRATLLESVLNYTPNELNLWLHARRAVTEAIITGMGVLWTEVKARPSGKMKLVGSFFDSVDNLVGDPDFADMREWQWCARRCVHPIWKVERDYGLEPGSIKGNLGSSGQDTELNHDQNGIFKRATGQSNDLLVYWKIYSKMGAGGRLQNSKDSQVDKLRGLLDQFGDYCYLVVAPGIDYPLNLPPKVLQAPADQALLEDVKNRLSWPTPFYEDDRWPFEPLYFHWVPGSAWPIGHITPALGEQMFMNWGYTGLANKIRTTCRDFIVMAESVSAEVERAIRNGHDLTTFKLKEIQGDINKVVQFLQHPQMNPDIFKVLQAVEGNFEQRTGLSEMMYGQSSRQLRSAAEANVKGEMVRVRPDDMAEQTERWMSEVARKEAIASRLHLRGQDVTPIVGPAGGLVWDKIVATANLEEISRELDYRVEAGSTRKPNTDRDMAISQDAMQFVLPVLMNLAQVNPANFGPINALLGDWAKAQGKPADSYMVQGPPPPPPMMMPPGQEGPPQEGGPPSEQQGPPQQGAPVDPAQALVAELMGGGVPA